VTALERYSVGTLSATAGVEAVVFELDFELDLPVETKRD
jgi:hypothetical protein